MAVKFALAMLACTVACTAIWQSCVADVLYYCSDPLWLDDPEGPPGRIHMGDTIRPGWSLGRLDTLWFSMLTASVVVSLVLSRIRWSGTRHNGPA